VPDQVVSVVAPLLSRGDGRHEVTLELRPEELGAIRVEVSVEHGTVYLTLHAAGRATAALLAGALPGLRSALTEAGLTVGHLGVGSGGGGGDGDRRPFARTDARDRAAGRARGAGESTAANPSPVQPVGSGRLDLLL
jgi:flagellar hook-length control protein FliK